MVEAEKERVLVVGLVEDGAAVGAPEDVILAVEVLAEGFNAGAYLLADRAPAAAAGAVAETRSYCGHVADGAGFAGGHGIASGWDDRIAGR